MAKAKAKDKNKSKSKSKPVAKAKPVAKKAAKPAAKKAAKPAAKKAAKPAPKKVVKPVAKKKAKPAPKKAVAKPAAKSVKPVKKAPVAPAKKAAPVAAKKPVAQPAKKVLKNTNTISKPQSVKSVKPIEKAKEKKPVIPAKQPVSKPTAVTRHITTTTPPERPFVNKQEKKMLEPTQPETNLRYSDEELKEFKDLIEKKLAAARDELKNLKESLDNHTESQAGNKAWNMEEGTDTSEMEYLMNQISRQHTFIRNLELALVRVENKTYGICRASGKLIPKERLRVVPHATLSLEAKNSRKVEEESPASQSSAAPPSDFAEGFED